MNPRTFFEGTFDIHFMQPEVAILFGFFVVKIIQEMHLQFVLSCWQVGFHVKQLRGLVFSGHRKRADGFTRNTHLRFSRLVPSLLGSCFEGEPIFASFLNVDGVFHIAAARQDNGACING